MRFFIVSLLITFGFVAGGKCMELYTDENAYFAVYGYLWGILACWVLGDLARTYKH